MAKILFVGAMYEHGSTSRGRSYEYYNLFQSLEQVADQVDSFDFLEVARGQGREAMNRELVMTVKRNRPDLVFVVPFTDELEPAAMDEIASVTKTIGYFFDDMWRVAYARAWAPHFTFITTSDVNGPGKFRSAGHSNVIYSPFACNTRIFVDKGLPVKYDVSFVGQFHPVRAWYLRQLRRAGLKVHAWGHGWPDGRVGQEAMVEIFNQSRINLNLSNTISWDVRYLSSLRRPMSETLRAWRGIWNAARHPDAKTREQVKGRHFEINACGGFQLTYYVEGLDRCYRIGDELAVYAAPDELVEKVRHFLANDDERMAIARRGHQRTLREHTMEKRFRDLLNQAGVRPSC